MKIGPKYKICKRLGSSVFEKCQTQKFQLAEARAPRRTGRGPRGGSDFGAQLLEKQKARFTYGMSEKQFSNYVSEAMEARGGTSATGLVMRLEARLDNVVFRAGLAPTRRAARQFVSHGHIMVDGRRMTIPSYRVHKGEVISVRPESRTSPLFASRPEKVAEVRTPEWMTLEDNGYAARIAAEPKADTAQLNFDPSVIIQFYSR